jgi:MoaA/NifB/PqqE/SkfB family radical SAM enzyme
MYTNGTLITRNVAERFTELGNVTPCISVEGYESQTDERRGKRVHKKIREAAKHLREIGIPFGFSVTATTRNYEVLLEDQFYDYYYDKLGATYMWQFQLMPIGQGKDSMELMITPPQRIELYRKWEHVLRKMDYPFADFWNSSALSNGCIAYGRWNGYFYIDWDGKIMPCVFIPYYDQKITDVYDAGGTLGDAIHSKIFRNGREWQKSYGFCNEENCGNKLMPCSIRDHFHEFKYHVLSEDSKGSDQDAEEAIHDPEYEKVMVEYDRELEILSEELFDEKFLKSLVRKEA